MENSSRYPRWYPDLLAGPVNQNLPHAGRYPGRYPDLQVENVIGYPKGYREKVWYPGRYPWFTTELWPVPRSPPLAVYNII